VRTTRHDFAVRDGGGRRSGFAFAEAGTEQRLTGTTWEGSRQSGSAGTERTGHINGHTPAQRLLTMPFGQADGGWGEEERTQGEEEEQQLGIFSSFRGGVVWSGEGEVQLLLRVQVQSCCRGKSTHSSTSAPPWLRLAR